MARSASSAKLSPSEPAGSRPIEPNALAAASGGPVGQMLRELDARMAPQPARMPYADVPEDIFHAFSVMAGYVGLAAAFAGSGAFIWWLIHLIV